MSDHSVATRCRGLSATCTPGYKSCHDFFFSPHQSNSVLKKTLSYLIVLSTLQFCWPVNKKFQYDTINYYFPRAEQRQPLQSLTWCGVKAFMVQKLSAQFTPRVTSIFLGSQSATWLGSNSYRGRNLNPSGLIWMLRQTQVEVLLKVNNLYSI